jgi:MFS family permease
MLLISIPAFLYADRWGRRASVITGGVLLSSSMYIVGSLYATDSVHITGAGRWVVIVLIFAFALSYVGTWGVVGKIYASEIQPARVRGAANSIAQGLGFVSFLISSTGSCVVYFLTGFQFTNWLVAFTTPIFLARSSYGAYFLFGSFSLLALVVLSIYMPETKGHSLEAIQEGFQGGGMKWKGRKVLRWFAGPKFTGREDGGIEMSGGNEDGLLSGEGILTGPTVVEFGFV